jgi:hypothetical protein
MYEITCKPENAHLFREWLDTRGGVAVWKSISLSNPHLSWSTPADNTRKPHWSAANEPAYVITDAGLVGVSKYEEVRRLKVSIRAAANGFGSIWKLTDTSSRAVNKALAKAGEDAIYAFDYETQEAIILVPTTITPLNEWTEQEK